MRYSNQTKMVAGLLLPLLDEAALTEAPATEEERQLGLFFLGRPIRHPVDVGAGGVAFGGGSSPYDP